MEHRFFSLVPAKPNVQFVAISKYTLWLSVVVLIACLALLFTKGLNYGVDFKGGNQMHVRFNQTKTASEVRSALEPHGFSQASVQDFGEDANNSEFLIRVPPEEIQVEDFKENIENVLKTQTGQKSVTVRYAQERLYARFPSPAKTEQVQAAITSLDNSNLSIQSVEAFGDSQDNEFLVQFSGVSSRLVKALKKEFQGSSFEVLQTEQVGAKVGKELRLQAVGAVLISVILILIYVWFRFDLEFAPGAILALIHDSLFVLGLFSLFSLQFDLSIVAAVLTIVGFSINDTIVVYDRVRENLKSMRNVPFEEVINRSLNDTLSRTLLTSGTLFLAAIALLVLGGPITKNFALSFTVGVIVGTYSTIFIASPLTISFYHYLQKRRAK